MVHETATEVYQLHVWILQISPRFVPVSYSPSDASVDQTDARKDAGEAHAVGGNELGGTSLYIRHAGKTTQRVER
jgi:hypothetical protein